MYNFVDVARESDVHLPKLLLVESQYFIGCCDTLLFKVGLVLAHFEAVEPLIHSRVVEGAGDNR